MRLIPSILNVANASEWELAINSCQHLNDNAFDLSGADVLKERFELIFKHMGLLPLI